MLLEWSGPFVYFPQTDLRCIFDDSIARSPGLYLWTVEKNGQYLINWVGETKVSFSTRLKRHYKWSLANGVYDLDLFALGEKHAFDRYPREFVDRFYGVYRIFVAPLAEHLEDRKSIESGLIRTLRSASPEVSSFLDNKAVKPVPACFEVLMKSPVRFHGLGRKVQC